MKGIPTFQRLFNITYRSIFHRSISRLCDKTISHSMLLVKDHKTNHFFFSFFDLNLNLCSILTCNFTFYYRYLVLLSRCKSVCIPRPVICLTEGRKMSENLLVWRTNGAIRTRSRHHNFYYFFHSLVAFHALCADYF